MFRPVTSSRIHTWLAAVVLSLAAGLPGFALSAPQAVGVWEISVEWPQGATEVTLTVAESPDSGFSATWDGPRGRLVAESVFSDGSELSFVIEVENQAGESVELRFEGRLSGDELSGRLLAPGGREIAAHGQRRDGQ